MMVLFYLHVFVFFALRTWEFIDKVIFQSNEAASCLQTVIIRRIQYIYKLKTVSILAITLDVTFIGITSLNISKLFYH